MGINVLIGGSVTGLLREFVETLTRSESDINIIEQNLPAHKAIDDPGPVRADVVILGSASENLDLSGHSVLEKFNHTSVIAVVPGNCDAVLYRLTPVRQPLGKLSIDSLLGAIRTCSVKSDGDHV